MKDSFFNISKEHKTEFTETNEKSHTIPLAETYVSDLVNIESASIPITKFSVDNLPKRIEERVFIGGDYSLMPILREMARFVQENGFQPVIAQDYDMPRERTRDYTLRLLVQCKYAIFEITSQTGQIPEIGVVLALFDFRSLIVYSKTSKPSIMYTQMSPEPKPYETLDELREIVSAFLKG